MAIGGYGFKSHLMDDLKKKWRPQGDLNPRRRRERAVSLAGLDDGDACYGEPSWDRTNGPLIKSQMLYQLSYGLPRNGPF